MLDEWERLAEVAGGIARRFIAVLEKHVLAINGCRDLATEMTAKLTADLGRLAHTAHQVVAAAVDASIAQETVRRLGDLTGDSVCG